MTPMNSSFFINPPECPSWLEYPNELVDLVVKGRVNLIPWHIMDAKRAAAEYAFLKKRYERELIPFAYRQDSDDFACLEKDAGFQIKIIHALSDKGWEDEYSYSSFQEWMNSVEMDMADWG